MHDPEGTSSASAERHREAAGVAGPASASVFSPGVGSGRTRYPPSDGSSRSNALVAAAASAAQISSRGWPARLRRVALLVQHAVHRRHQGGDYPLLRVVDAGLGGDRVAERALALVEHVQAPAGQHRAVLDHPRERGTGQPERHVGPGHPLGVVAPDRGEQALARGAGGEDVGQAADDPLGPVEDQVLLAREVVRDRHLGDPRRVGDLRDRHLVKAAGHEHLGRHVGDGLPGLPASAARAALCSCCQLADI